MSTVPPPPPPPPAAWATGIPDLASSPPPQPAVPERPPLSKLALWGALSALPVAPLGIVLCSLALPRTSQGRSRGHALAMVGLVVSIFVVVLGVVHVVSVAADVLAILAEPLDAPDAVDAGSSGQAPLFGDEMPTTCTHDPGSPYATVDWSASSLAGTGYRSELTAYVLDSSGATVGHGVIDMGDQAGNEQGQARVRVDPQATVDSCMLTFAIYTG